MTLTTKQLMVIQLIKFKVILSTVLANVSCFNSAPIREGESQHVWRIGVSATLMMNTRRTNPTLTYRLKHGRNTKFRNITMSGAGPLSREGSLSCHTYCDTLPPVFRSHPKDLPIQSPLMTHKGMWRIYSNLDLHGYQSLYDTQRDVEDLF